MLRIISQFKVTGSLSAVLLLAGASSPALAETVALKVELTGAAQVPPTDTRGIGAGEVTYDTMSRLLTWTVTYSGLSGPPTAAHFHGPAEPGKNAGPLVVMEGDLVSSIRGQAMLTPAQAEELLAGLWYINIHTAFHPGGEIRGQVPRPD